MAQHLHTLEWPIQLKSCSKSGIGIVNVYSWYITTAERTEQISKKQESFMEQDNIARSCLTNWEWHVVIIVGVLPWASEISYHLGELWKRAGRGLMNVAWGSVAWKSVQHREEAKQTKRAVKRETEGSEREEVVWEMRGEAQFQHERGPSTHGSPHCSACGKQRDPSHLALLWRSQCCKALGCHHKTAICLSPVLVSLSVFTQRCVSMRKGAWSLLC